MRPFLLGANSGLLTLFLDSVEKPLNLGCTCVNLNFQLRSFSFLTLILDGLLKHTCMKLFLNSSPAEYQCPMRLTQWAFRNKTKHKTKS